MLQCLIVSGVLYAWNIKKQNIHARGVMNDTLTDGQPNEYFTTSSVPLVKAVIGGRLYLANEVAHDAVVFFWKATEAVILVEKQNNPSRTYWELVGRKLWVLVGF